MAIEVRVPTEITEYREKIIAGLSLRQMAFLVIGACVGGGVFVLSYKIIGVDNASTLLVYLVMPIFAFGFVKVRGYPLEKFLLILLKHRIWPQKRNYKIALQLAGQYGEEEHVVIQKAKKERRNECTIGFDKRKSKRNRKRALQSCRQAKKDAIHAKTKATNKTSESSENHTANAAV